MNIRIQSREIFEYYSRDFSPGRLRISKIMKYKDAQWGINPQNKNIDSLKDFSETLSSLVYLFPWYGLGSMPQNIIQNVNNQSLK